MWNFEWRCCSTAAHMHEPPLLIEIPSRIRLSALSHIGCSVKPPLSKHTQTYFYSCVKAACFALVAFHQFSWEFLSSLWNVVIVLINFFIKLSKCNSKSIPLLNIPQFGDEKWCLLMLVIELNHRFTLWLLE